jgi:formylglycine-generating enzyme required for sulfatase activity
MHSPAISTGNTSVSPNSQVAFDSMAGTVSSSALGAEEQAQIASARAEYEKEQQQRDQIAREELDREADARRQAKEEKERKRKEEEERVRKEEEERAERERQAREQMERVERQAKELEERLSRLATSMVPGATVAESALAVGVNTGAGNSFPGVAGSLPGVSTSLPGALEPAKGNSMLLIGGVVLVILLIGGGAAAYFLTRPKPAPPVVGQTTPPTNPTNNPSGSIKADLVEIPGGTFQMGRNDGPPQERPEHSVTVPAFYMDRTEVTNAEYAEFVHDMGYEVPSHWVKGQPLPGQEQWPVVNVSPKDAEAFAAWRSKRDGVTYRLPTEEEWEFAARSGGEYKAYPWGDTWQDKRAVVKEATPQPVGTYPEGKDKWGVVDLIGNAWEWTSSKASIYNGAADIPSASKEWEVARGGSYASDPKDRQIPVSATYRDWYPPTTRHQNFGFRLVRSA